MEIAQKHFFSIVFVLLGSIILAVSFTKASSNAFFERSIGDRQTVAWQGHNTPRDIELFPFRF